MFWPSISTHLQCRARASYSYAISPQVHADHECSYLRFEDLHFRGCHYALDAPDAHNHVIEAVGLTRAGGASRGRRVWDALALRKGIPQPLSWWWRLPLYGLLLAISAGASVLILAYAQSFASEEGNGKVTAFIISAVTVLTIDALVKQPLLLTGILAVIHLLSF